MATPVLVEEVEGKGRMYRDPGTGALLPSVSNVIGLLAPRSELLAWTARTVAEYAVAHLAPLTEIAAADPWTAVEVLRESAERPRSLAASRGALVHAVAEALARGEQPPAHTPGELPYVRAWLEFVRDFRPSFLAVEAVLLNRTHAYAGTADFIARIGGRLVVGDYKTARKGVFREVALQLAALARAEWLVGPDGALVPMRPLDGAIAVHLAPSGYSVHPVDAGERAWRAFLGLRAAWDFHTDGHGAVGVPVMTPEEMTP